MPSLTRTIETDVCVVGAGLIGLAHALEARRRGLSVVLLERDVRAAGASVRQTGHLFFSALASGDGLDAAPLARERWLELSRQAGIFVEATGTLIVARHRDELAVMEVAAADAARHAQLLTATEIGSLAPIPLGGVIGGLHAAQDLRIDPRAASGALARLLMRDANAHVEWGAPVHDVEPGTVHAGALRVHAPAIVVCPGAGQRVLPPDLCSRQHEALKLRRMQMLRLGAPTGRRYGPTLATGLSLLQQPAFATQVEAEVVRARLELEKPEAIESGVQLLVAQLSDGDIVVGESRTNVEAPPPFALERIYRLLLDEVRDLLGTLPAVHQRWQATQLCVDAEDPRDFSVSAPLPGLRVVLAVSGRALALAHAKAAEVLDEMLDPGTSITGLENVGSREFVLVDERGRGGVRAHPAAFRARRGDA